MEDPAMPTQPQVVLMIEGPSWPSLDFTPPTVEQDPARKRFRVNGIPLYLEKQSLGNEVEWLP